MGALASGGVASVRRGTLPFVRQFVSVLILRAGTFDLEGAHVIASRPPYGALVKWNFSPY